MASDIRNLEIDYQVAPVLGDVAFFDGNVWAPFSSLELIKLWLPVGIYVPYVGADDPDGWLICDGRTIDRAIYATLYAIIGDNYGSGDGFSTFNIPNMKGRFPLGKADSGTGSTIGMSGGAIDHTHDVPGHFHNDLAAKESSAASGTSGDHFVSNNSGGTRTFGSSVIGNQAGSDGDSAFATTSQNPPYLVSNYIIWTGVTAPTPSPVGGTLMGILGLTYP